MGAMGRRLKEIHAAVRDDLSVRGLDWKGFIVLGAAVLIFVLPFYHTHAFHNLIRKANIAFLYRTLWQNGIDFHFVMKLVFPLIVIIAMRERLTDFGLGLGKMGLGLKISGLLVLLYLPLFYIFVTDEASLKTYRSAALHPSWGVFMKKELFSNFVFMLRTEFLYRGFLLFGFRKPLGDFGAVCVSTLPYVMMHAGKSELEALGSFPVGLALCYLALKTGSIWWGLLLHWSIAVLYLGFVYCMA
jgi:membrane protease YdiL (CAAX protease family)